MKPKASSCNKNEAIGCPTPSTASSHDDESDSDSATVPCEPSVGVSLSSGLKARRQVQYNVDSITQKRELLDGLQVLPVWIVQDGKKSILVDEESKTSGFFARRKTSRRVTFTNVYLREYGLTLGDNPSVSSGPPISISWEHTPTEVMPLEGFEECFYDSDCEKRTTVELAVPKILREKWLRDDWGVSQADMATAVREVNKIKHSRRRNYHKLTSTAGKFERVISKVFERRRSRIDREAARLERKHASAVAAEKQIQLENEYKLRLLSNSDLHKYRNILLRNGSKEQSTDSTASKEPSLEETLVEKHPPPLDTRAKKSILKNKNPAENRMLVEGNGQMQSNGKQVSFATRASTTKVLCSVHEYLRVSGRFQWPDENEHSSLWWLPQEMELRHELDMDIVSLVKDQMQCLLVGAFKSTKTVCASKETDPEMVSSSSVQLDFNRLAACDVARGLEKEVIPRVFSFVIKTHRKMVLAKQASLFRSKESCDSKNNTAVREKHMEVIRRKSLRYSLPSRLLALKLAAYDEFIKPVS